MNAWRDKGATAVERYWTPERYNSAKPAVRRVVRLCSQVLASLVPAVDAARRSFSRKATYAGAEIEASPEASLGPG